MNFYKHHLGDYAAATSHLSWDEDCAYRRLLDQYYKRESALPADVKESARLARATTPSQKRAVEAVLIEFFTLQDDGWHQKRCDEEIGTATAQAETNRRIAEEREAKRRARIANESLNGSANDPSTNRSPTPIGGRAESVNLARLQTPDSTSQTPDKEKGRALSSVAAREPEAEGHQPTPAGLACKAMKRGGLQAVNPGDPRLITLCDQGATEAEFEGIAAEAVEKGKGFAWVLTVLQSRRAEAASIALAPPPAVDPMEWTKTRSGVVNRAANLGLEPPDGDPRRWQAYVQHVIAVDAQQQRAHA